MNYESVLSQLDQREAQTRDALTKVGAAELLAVVELLVTTLEYARMAAEAGKPELREQYLDAPWQTAPVWGKHLILLLATQTLGRHILSRATTDPKWAEGLKKEGL